MDLKSAIKQTHPVYYVSDIKRTGDFYTNCLGLEKAWDFGGNIIGINLLPGSLLVFCEDADKVRGDATSVFVLAVTDIDAVYEKLKSNGVVFAGPPEDTPVGRLASFADPDGYRFDLCG